jgi:hypothetical protein
MYLLLVGDRIVVGLALIGDWSWSRTCTYWRLELESDLDIILCGRGIYVAAGGVQLS